MHGIFSANYEKNSDQKMELHLSICVDKSYNSNRFFLVFDLFLEIFPQCGLALSWIPQHSQKTHGVIK